jgi:hypothetical protein
MCPTFDAASLRMGIVLPVWRKRFPMVQCRRPRSQPLTRRRDGREKATAPRRRVRQIGDRRHKKTRVGASLQLLRRRKDHVRHIGRHR